MSGSAMPPRSSTQGQCWYPAIETDDGLREGAWVAEATDLVDMSPWPAGTRLILRKERPHPGAQLNFTDSDGHRVTAFITDTAPGVVPGSTRRPGTAPPPTRPRRGPHPRGQGHRAGQPALSPRPGQHRLAGNHPGRNRSGRMGTADRLHRPSRARPLRDRHLPLPGPARRRPHHQKCPPNPATHRRHLALGHRHLPRMATTFGKHSPNQPDTIRPTPENPPALESPHAQRHGPTRHTQHRQSRPTGNQRRIHPSRPGR